MRRTAIALLLSSTFISCMPAKDPSATKWADWVEADFPFFSTVLDARDLGEQAPQNNLTPRGIVLNLGNDLWACFDVDLLRIACIWEGKEGEPPITLNALAPGSYEIAGQKTKDGQENLPKIIGTPWVANGIYPGWRVLPSANAKVDFTDPRKAAPTKEEVGIGPASPDELKFKAIKRTSEGAVIILEAGGRTIEQHLLSKKINDGQAEPVLDLVIAPGDATLQLSTGVPLAAELTTAGEWNAEQAEIVSGKDQADSFIIKPSTEPIRLRITWSAKKKHAEEPLEIISDAADPVRWPETVTTSAELSKDKEDSLVTDNIPLPFENPWKRNVRLADIAFLDDKGNAAAVTFDGDVWLVSGVKDDLKKVTWKRYTSGLHEPMNIAVRDGEMFVFDRNGIWKLVDKDNNGEAETHELFCNLFTQTAETREFPNSMKLGPDGSFYLAKGGQQGTTIGIDNGTVLKVAPDGKSYEVIGYGLRQPFIGVHPKTGLVTASDQQGNYVPSTPIHLIQNHHYYGFLSDLLPEEKYPEKIAEPIGWIPHPVNPSGASQVWLTDAKMGPLNDELIHIGYNRPELFRVLINQRFKQPQATVMPLTRDLHTPPLNGTVNPADGQLYISGFQVWGTTAKEISGLDRLRYTGKPRVLLKECTPMDKGVLLTFNAALDEKAALDTASYSIERWNYKRTPKYGSPHLKLDGTPGQEWMAASSAYLSEDRKSVFVGLPDMQPVMQMRVGWGLKSAEGLPAQNSAYITPAELASFNPEKEGFGKIVVDLAPKEKVAVIEMEPTLDEGKRIAEMIGCMACHSIDGSVVGKVGPSWKGLYNSKRTLKDNKKVKADEEYLHESIVNPSAKVVKGFEKFDAGMPIYAGILNEAQIQSLILYIKSL